MRLRRLRLLAIVVPLSVLFISGCDGPESGAGQSAVSSGTLPDRQAESERIEAYYPRLADCMTDNGFPTSYDPAEGAMIVQGDIDDAALAEDDCRKELGPEPTREPLTPDELNRLFDLKVGAYECLVEQGFGPAQPPTREQWLGDYASGNAWEPFDDPDSNVLFPEGVCKDPGAGDLAPSS